MELEYIHSKVLVRYMEKSKKKWAIVLSILILCAAIVFIVVVLPHLLACYKCVSPCSRVESDANNIAAAISDYFAIPGRTDIKNSDIARSFTPWNPWTLIKCEDKIYIYVYDRQEGCPVDYQNADPNWNSHIYTKIFE